MWAGRGRDLARAGCRTGAGSGAARALDDGARGIPQGECLSLARRRIIVALAALVFVSLITPRAVWSAERASGYVLDWDSGTGKSYVIPAAEIVGFIGALNAFNRLVIDEDTYGTDGHSIWENLHTAPVFDNDPFHVNQIGHPYQGSIYYGLARSAGLNYLESLAATLCRRDSGSIASCSASASSRCFQATTRPCTSASAPASRSPRAWPTRIC